MSRRGLLGIAIAVGLVGAGGAIYGLLRNAGHSGPTDTDGNQELLIFVGAGIRPPISELAEIFSAENNAKVVPSYAGSEFLLSNIKLARRGDIYMPGDKHYVDQAAAAGLILSQKSVCYFVPTILVQKGNPQGIKNLADLLGPGIKLGLGDEKACAIGRKSRRIFKKNRMSWPDVEKNLIFQSATVNELGIHIQTKSLDAVIVWDAVARYYSRYGDEVPIPTDRNVISTVDAGVLKFTRHRALAEKFIELACSPRGQAVFKKHNYRVTLPE
jgi:molybdate transport system substrate-binding protein